MVRKYFKDGDLSVYGTSEVSKGYKDWSYEAWRAVDPADVMVTPATTPEGKPILMNSRRLAKRRVQGVQTIGYRQLTKEDVEPSTPAASAAVCGQPGTFTMRDPRDPEMPLLGDQQVLMQPTQAGVGLDYCGWLGFKSVDQVKNLVSNALEALKARMQLEQAMHPFSVDVELSLTARARFGSENDFCTADDTAALQGEVGAIRVSKIEALAASTKTLASFTESQFRGVFRLAGNPLVGMWKTRLMAELMANPTELTISLLVALPDQLGSISASGIGGSDLQQLQDIGGWNQLFGDEKSTAAALTAVVHADYLVGDVLDAIFGKIGAWLGIPKQDVTPPALRPTGPSSPKLTRDAAAGAEVEDLDPAANNELKTFGTTAPSDTSTPDQVGNGAFMFLGKCLASAAFRVLREYGIRAGVHALVSSGRVRRWPTRPRTSTSAALSLATPS